MLSFDIPPFNIQYSVLDICYSVFDIHYSVSFFSLILLPRIISRFSALSFLSLDLGYLDILRFCLSFSHGTGDSAMLPFGDCSLLMCLAYACGWIMLAAGRLLVSVFPRVVGDSRLHEFSWDAECLDWIEKGIVNEMDWIELFSLDFIWMFGNFC